MPSWSGDGKWIYYSNNETGRDEIWKRPVQGGQAIQVTHNGGFVAFEFLDGLCLYYSKVDARKWGSLWALPLAGGDEKQVLASVWSRNFAIVKEGIYYETNAAADGTSSLRFPHFSTGEDTEIVPIKNPYNGLTVSADRETVLFTTIVRTGSNIMVVDHFR